jgi:hypothetical protein
MYSGTMQNVFIFFITLILLISRGNAQPLLHWDRTFTGNSYLNQTKVCRDKIGNTWGLLVTTSTKRIDEIKKDSALFGNEALLKMNPNGAIERTVEFKYPSWRGMSTMATSPNNELWMLSVYTGDMSIRNAGQTIEVKADSVGIGGLLLTVFTAQGDIRLTKNIYLPNYDNMLDIAFDSKGNAHILTQEIKREYEPYDGKETKFKEHYTLHHGVVNGEGNLIKHDTFYVPVKFSGNLSGSHIHITPHDDYYITTRYTSSVKMNGEEIIANVNPVTKENTDGEWHGLLMHFDKKGNFTWHKTLFGFGTQNILSITSDSMNVYCSVLYNHECIINNENKIFYDYKTPAISSGLMWMGLSHDGQLKWTKHVTSQRDNSVYISCFGLETDMKGQLFIFCNFSRTITISGKYFDFLLQYDHNQMGANFLMIADTLGDVLDIRKDVVHEAGTAIYTDSDISKNDLSVTGYYLPGPIKQAPSADGTMPEVINYDTRIHVEIDGHEGAPFRHNKHWGGVFFYSYHQPPLVPEDNIQEPGDEEPIDSTIFDFAALIDDSKPSSDTIANEVPDVVVSDSTITIIPHVEAARSDLILNLFPVPTREILNMHAAGLEDFYQIDIYSLSGKLVYSGRSFIDGWEIDWKYNVQSWAADTYLFKLTTGGNKMITKRWVKLG